MSVESLQYSHCNWASINSEFKRINITHVHAGAGKMKIGIAIYKLLMGKSSGIICIGIGPK